MGRMLGVGAVYFYTVSQSVKADGREKMGVGGGRKVSNECRGDYMDRSSSHFGASSETSHLFLSRGLDKLSWNKRDGS